MFDMCGGRGDWDGSSWQETDKATIDVEASDDGVLGKIVVSCLLYTTA